MAEEIYQGDGSMKQDTAKKVPNPNAKRQTITTVIIVVAIVLCGIYYIWDNFLGIQPDVKVEGTQISMHNTVQDLLDAGFVLCNNEGHVSNSADAIVGAKEVYNVDYYLGIPRESGGMYCDCTGVRITAANFDNSKKELKDCAIFAVAYYPGFQDIGVEVLIHGQDLSEASFDEWMDFFENAGYPFKKDELDECRRGDSGLLLETKGRYKYEANVWEKYGEYQIFSLSFTRDIDVTYKTR